MDPHPPHNVQRTTSRHPQPSPHSSRRPPSLFLCRLTAFQHHPRSIHPADASGQSSNARSSVLSYARGKSSVISSAKNLIHQVLRLWDSSTRDSTLRRTPTRRLITPWTTSACTSCVIRRVRASRRWSRSSTRRMFQRRRKRANDRSPRSISRPRASSCSR